MTYLPNLIKLIFTILFFSLFISCNYNPLGGSNSHIDEGNTPFFNTPSPFSITGTLADSGQISILWSPSTNADFYTVWYGTSNSNFTNSLSGCVANLTCVIPNLTNGSLYYIKVTATNRYGSLDSTNIVSANVRPFNSLIAIAGNTEAYLSWNAVDIVDNYTISYGVYPGLYTSTISGITNTFAVIPGLINGTTYQFKVTASNVLGTEISNQALVTPMAPPTAPTSVTTTALSTTQVKINWGASSGFGTITYEVSRSLTFGGPYEVVVSGLSSSTLTYTDTSASPGNQYYYVVTASNSTATTSNSNQATATTPAAAPTNLAGNANSPTSVTLTWTASLGNSTITYNMLRSSTMGSGYTSIGTGSCSSSITSPTVTCTDTNVTAGNIYYYVVTATNVGGVSSNSSEATVTTPTTAPTGLIATATSTTNVNLSWTASPGNSTITYIVYRSLTNGSGYVAVNSPTCTSTISSTTCTDTTASAGNLYFYVVTATNSAATTSNSTSSNTTTQTTAPTGLTATISSATSINISWTASSGNANMTYNVKRSIVSGSSYTGITSGVCSGNVNSPTVSCSDLSPISGNTYFYIVTVKNAFNVTLTSAAEVSIVFSPPTNTVAPSISGTGYTASSGIISATGNVLTANQGTWGGGPTSSCTNQWYSNNNLISGATNTTYTTVAADICRVIDVKVTCSNSIGSNFVRTMNTNGTLNSYVGRVQAVGGYTLNSTGQTQILNFLNNLFTNNIAFPDYLYAMRNHQNVGTGSVLYDFFCNAHNANLNTYNNWDSRGIYNSTTNYSSNTTQAIATVPSVFTAVPSTIIATTRSPTFISQYRGVSGYTSDNFSIGPASFGYANTTNNLLLQSPWDGGATSISSITSGLYDFWGFSANGSSYNWKFNTQLQRGPTASNKLGINGWAIGSFSNCCGLNDYMPFAAAWNTQALSLSQMETIRGFYYSTLGQSLQTFAYITSWDSSAVQRCLIDNFSGALSGCTTVITSATLSAPVSTVISSANISYTASFNNGVITKCAVNLTNGTLGSCGNAGTISSGGPHGMAVTNTNIYFADYSGQKLWQCALNADGTFTQANCNTLSIPTGTGPQGLLIIGSYLVNASSTNQINSCLISNVNGTLSTCTRTGSTDGSGTSNFVGLNNSRGIAIATISGTTYGYIINDGSNSVTRCNVNIATGIFTNCATNLSSNLNRPRGIDIYTTLNGTVNAYIANRSGTSVTICSINTSGNLTGCSVTSGGTAGFNAPEEIHLKNF